MKAFKKVLALLLVLSLVLVMTACGDSDDDDSSKKGESRKASSSQNDDEKTTPTADPTDEPTPEPTDDPTPAPTADPTSEPTPVPTQIPSGPVSGDPVSYNDIKGVWKCDLNLDASQFGEMYDDSAAQIFEIFTKFGYSPVIKLHLEINFETEEDAVMTYEMDGSELGKAMKEMFSTEEGLLNFYAAAMGMDADSIKSLLAMSGMSVSDLAAQLDVDELMDELHETDEKDFEYKITNNEIIMSDDAQVTLVYDSSANVLRFKVDPNSSDAAQITAIFGNSVLTR